MCQLPACSGHIGNKFVEQIADVVWAGAGFGVALEGEGRAVGQFDALQRTVKQRTVGYAGVGGQGGGIDFKAVVLAGNHHAAAVQILHGVVGAVVAERHFAGLAAEREPQKLVAETDAEKGFAAFEHLAQGGNGVVAGFGVARAVGEEDAVGIQGEGFGGGGLRGDDG